MKSKSFILFLISWLILLGTILVSWQWSNWGLGENKIPLGISVTIAFGVSIAGFIIGIGEIKINKTLKIWIALIGHTITIGFFALIAAYASTLD